MAESEKHSIRLSKAVKEFNVGLSTIVEFLSRKGHHIESSPNTKISSDLYDLLDREFQSQKSVKEEAKKIGLDYSGHQTISIEDKKVKEKPFESDEDSDEIFIKQLSISKKEKESRIAEPQAHEEKIAADHLEKGEPAAGKKAKVVSQELAESKPSKSVQESAVAEKEHVKIDGKQKVAAKHEDAGSDALEAEKLKEEKPEIQPKIVGKIDLDSLNLRTKPPRKSAF
ncbi:MAG: hypothetical protein FJY07_05520, partial [Bacteroidetes bacterium]|nr:hypothetical protein [Bacteroidota bacterium]